MHFFSERLKESETKSEIPPSSLGLLVMGFNGLPPLSLKSSQSDTLTPLVILSFAL